MDGTKNWGILTEAHGMWIMQQMRQGFLGCGPGSSSVLLPANRNREHQPPAVTGRTAGIISQVPAHTTPPRMRLCRIAPYSD